MPACSVKQCGARKTINQPTLTLHRFPVNEIMKKKWIEIIGIENINPRHKMWYLCSMHFDETCFNRTLDVTRLRDGAVPLSSLLIANKTRIDVLHQRQNISTSISPVKLELLHDNSSKNALLVNKIQPQNLELKKLTEKCDLLTRKVRSLNEKVRRRDGKVALFSDIIKDLQNREFVNNQETIILEECAGPEDFLKRQIAKFKGLPLEKKYSEELRKFALTLHFYSPKAYNFK